MKIKKIVIIVKNFYHGGFAKYELYDLDEAKEIFDGFLQEGRDVTFCVEVDPEAVKDLEVEIPF